ncbi:MAG: hypothetical protein DRP85_03530 [Candidatus Makaraimicrobium thalassicum]|nr:MAG: hypothetical protein DRP85_03530 [Candidatus Omnitrophota bacterium]
MVLLSDIKGQNNAVRYLSGSLCSGRIAGSYLFSGPEGVGRALCARAFVLALVCPERATGEAEACLRCLACRRVSALEHPDIRWIKPEKNRAIKIDEIRRIRDVLSLKPYEAPVSVCVIEDAHMMTIEASNALLKVLEEPPGRSLLILITDRKELLLPTVVSRCTEVGFRFLPVSEVRDIILREAADVSEETAEFLAYFSQGSPGRALAMIEDGLEERKKELIALVEGIIKEKNPSCCNWNKENKDRLLEDIEMLIMFFRDTAMGKEGLKDMILDKGIAGTDMYRFFEKYSIDKIHSVIERLIRMKLAMEGNANPKLVAQALPGIL